MRHNFRGHLDRLRGGNRTAVYLRMSTDNQRYSIENQAQALGTYAFDHNLRIVRAYADEGKSGLTFQGRPALQSLIADVQEPDCPFDVLLVLDVSRWGRFQNIDESAHYEFVCWAGGVNVIYCAEPFENDGSPMSAIVKSIRRVMAHEYLQDLARRVTAGKLNKARKGLIVGGMAPYGLMRVAIDQHRDVRAPLLRHERKAFLLDEVSFMPGEARAVQVVRRIFRQFAFEGRGETWIARALNADQIASPEGKLWGGSTVRHMLTNQAYGGHMVYNQKSAVLKAKRKINPVDQQVWCMDAFPAIVNKKTLTAARNRLANRLACRSNPHLLEQLRAFSERNARVSCALINADPTMPRSSLYGVRFGSVSAAYRQVGIRTVSRFQGSDKRRRYHEILRLLVEEVAGLLTVGAPLIEVIRRRRLLTPEGVCQLGVKLAHFQQPLNRLDDGYWQAKFNPHARLYLVARMTTDDADVLDYFLFLGSSMSDKPIHLMAKSDPITEAHRFTRLEDLVPLSERLLAGKVPQPLRQFGQSVGERTKRQLRYHSE
jgi:DNA invertase Pin-like site-specific DNA recombinase